MLTIQIVIANIRVAEPTANGCLSSVPKKAAEFAETIDRTSAKIEASSAGFADYVDVKGIEAIIPVEVEPLESNP